MLSLIVHRKGPLQEEALWDQEVPGVPEQQCPSFPVQRLPVLQLLQLTLQLQASRLARGPSPQDCQQYIGLLRPLCVLVGCCEVQFLLEPFSQQCRPLLSWLLSARTSLCTGALQADSSSLVLRKRPGMKVVTMETRR